ncbi:MAG: hypothetical protein U0V48_13860 [Anaerolineales bacterium]
MAYRASTEKRVYDNILGAMGKHAACTVVRIAKDLPGSLYAKIEWMNL